MNLIQSGKDAPNRPPDNPLPRAAPTERRAYKRHDITDKHMTLLNEQDIFMIQDVSHSGFKTKASERSIERLHVGDVYAFKIRYLGETYSGEAHVRWKKHPYIGFELAENNQTIVTFFTRIIAPRKIGQSFNKVKESYLTSSVPEDILWYAGSYNSNLFLWQKQDNDILAWVLQLEKKILGWSPIHELFIYSAQAPLTALEAISILKGTKDFEPHPASLDNRQLAIDIMMASQLDLKDKIIETLTP